MKPSFVTPVLAKVARRAGAHLTVEPRYGYAGRITFENGTRRYFKGTCFDLNPLGASEIAKDKAYATFFMQKLGYRTVEGESFFTQDWCRVIKSDRDAEAAYRYASTLGWPVIVKPNSLSQGAGVCKVHNRRELMRAVASFSGRERVFLVQRFIQGRDYRVVVLNNEVISAYERMPLAVVGDGVSTILTLLHQKQARFEALGRDTVIKIRDFRIATRLRRRRLSMRTVPASGATVVLLDNANLSAGGDARDVTASIHPSARKLATQLTSDMGLRFCGVDLLLSHQIDEPLQGYHILEINAAPGLDHYANMGNDQRRLVEDLYLKVLLAMRDSP